MGGAEGYLTLLIRTSHGGSDGARLNPTPTEWLRKFSPTFTRQNVLERTTVYNHYYNQFIYFTTKFRTTIKSRFFMRYPVILCIKTTQTVRPTVERRDQTLY